MVVSSCLANLMVRSASLRPQAEDAKLILERDRERNAIEMRLHQFPRANLAGTDHTALRQARASQNVLHGSLISIL